MKTATPVKLTARNLSAAAIKSRADLLRHFGLHLERLDYQVTYHRDGSFTAKVKPK
jgi:hypothetical protein